MAFDAAARIEAASTLNPALGDSVPRPFAGRTRPDRAAAAARPRTPAATGVRRRAPPSRDEADVLGGVGLLVIGRGHRDHGAAEHPAEVARPAPVGELDAVAKQLGRRALMLAAVPFADPLIERPPPADRAREGIESYLEPDRIGHHPGEGERLPRFGRSTPEPAAPHQSTHQGRRSNPASPPRTPPGAAASDHQRTPPGKRSPALSAAASGAG
jgi:hypothetical protein